MDDVKLARAREAAATRGRQHPIGEPEIKAVQPATIDGEAKSLPWTTLGATTDLVGAESIASRRAS